MSFLRVRSNRIIIVFFVTACILIALSSRVPPDHPARAQIKKVLSSDNLRIPWPKTPAYNEDPEYGTVHHHDLIVDHPNGRPKVIGMDPATSHRYREDGYVEVNSRGPHPIYELITRAEKDWKFKNDRASKTLDQAVAEYKRRYARPPPKGFDKWWTFVQQRKILLPDEYDRIHDDIEPFWGINPSVLSTSQKTREQEKGTFTIVCAGGKISLGPNHVDQKDPNYKKILENINGQLEMLRQVGPFLPDFRATFNAHSNPSQVTNYELRKAAVEAASHQKVLDVKQKFTPKSFEWKASCPPSSLLGKKTKPPKRPDIKKIWQGQGKTFIAEHKVAMDPCLHPNYVWFNGYLQSVNNTPATAETLIPTFSFSTTPLHSDILAIPMEDWKEDPLEDPQWGSKMHSKLYWRGSTTGAQFIGEQWWNLTQRIRLVSDLNEQEGEVWVLPSTESKFDPVGSGERVERGLLNGEWIDALFTGKPEQCIGDACATLAKGFKFTEKEPFEYEKQWKYLIDVDGNGASSRFKRLMTARGLVLKSTIHPEWYTDRIQPWVHYVPVKYDYTDLYDIVTFFRGDIDLRGGDGHDEMAAMIGMNGRRWSLTHWRKEDMVAYTFRLMLEYARVMSPDRAKMNYGS